MSNKILVAIISIAIIASGVGAYFNFQEKALAEETETPSIPTNLQAEVVSLSEISLFWNASTDDVGVAGYKIYRDGEQIGTTTETFYSDTTFSSNTEHTYTITASNASDIDVEFFPDTNTHIVTIYNASDVDTDADTESSPNAYIYAVTAYDASENESNPSEEVSVTVSSINIIPQTNWNLIYVDSEESTSRDYPGGYAFDGNINTFWHSGWLINNPTAVLPHEIQIDLGSAYNVSGFSYLPRTDGGNGNIKNYEFYVSSNTADWGTAVVGTFPVDTTEQEILFSNSKTGRYIKLVSLSSQPYSEVTVVRELNVFGTAIIDIEAPSAPTDFQATVVSSSKSSLSWSASADNVGVAGYKIYRDGEQIDSIIETFYLDTSLFPNTMYTYAVLAYDTAGNESALSEEAQVTTPLMPDIIPQANWNLIYVDSEESTSRDYRGEYAFDADVNTFWHSGWLINNPTAVLPHEIQIDLGSAYNVSGFSYLPRTDGGNGNIKNYEFYVSDDAVNWGPAVLTETFPADTSEQEVLFTPKTGRYIRLVALSSQPYSEVTVIRELNIIGIEIPSEPSLDLIPQSDYTLLYIDSEELVSKDQRGEYAFDNDPATFWHSEWLINNPAAILPHEIQIDLGSTYNVSAFRYLPRVDGGNGNIKDYEFYVSDNTSDWGPAVITETFPQDTSEQEVSFTPKTGRYVRLVALSSQPYSEVTVVRELNVFGTEILSDTISQDSWTLLYVDSEELVSADRRGEYAFDNNINTKWHTEWIRNNPDAVLPHEIQIDLNAVYDISGFRYLPNALGGNGCAGMYEFYVSLNGVDWGNPVISGILTDTHQEHEILFPSETARYIRFVALTEVNDVPVTSIAEFNLLGVPFSGNYAPNSIISSPADNLIINVGQGVNFTGTATDMEAHEPFQYVWHFDDASIPDQYVKDPGVITFNNPGIYTITLNVTDSLGRIDTTPAARIISVINDSDRLISHDKWTLHSVDSEELIAEYTPAEYCFDSDSDTIWQTEWSENTPLPPHHISINLGSAYELYEFKYLPRQDISNGRISRYQFYVSVDGINWGNTVATGIFDNDSTEKTVLFTPTTGQFIRLVALSEVYENPWTSIAEMNVHGDCTTPFVRIIDPQTGGIQQKPNMTVTASVCLNPDIHTGWGVKFVIDNGAAEQIVTLPSDGIIHADTFSAVFSGLNPADHVIEAFIVDDQNITVPGEETYHMISGVGLGDYYVAIGDSITYGVGDDYHNDDISQDWRNFDGGYTPILNDLLTAETSYAHTVINEGLPGEKTSEGASRLSNVIEQHSTAKFYLIQYGTNDRLHNLPSGFGTLPGQPGYAGSYKDFMQQMIDQITDAGANAYIAKVPSRYPELLDYAEYNLVIDELVVSNDITVIPPDFYAYFQNHPEGMSYDGFHPNGLGYQGMADLWFEAITNL